MTTSSPSDSPCDLCPRQCRAARRDGETGFCGVAAEPMVSSSGPHFGEERPLVGRGGSGTIFMASCSLGCLFCQNSSISHGRQGDDVTVEQLAKIMLFLEDRGCENVNFVTPTHFTPAVIDAVRIARQQGLDLPIVYNCGGYERVETLRLLEGTVDIYMPDLKTLDPAFSEKYLQTDDYPAIVLPALREMQCQVGDLVIEHGIAVRGLLVRHLVMPGGTTDSIRIIDTIREEISPHAYVNIMPQYRPCHRAYSFPEISAPLDMDEYAGVTRHAAASSLRLD